MTSQKSNQPSLQHSRVSSSSSSSSTPSYQLIPRQQPFSNLNRDAASPRASFPFKKVQAGFQSSLANKSQNDSQGSIKEERRKGQQQSKQLIDSIGQMNNSRKIPKNIDHEPYEISHQIKHEQCLAQIQRHQNRINELEKLLSDFQLEKSANQIYTHEFAKIRDLISEKYAKLQTQGIQEVVQKLRDILKYKSGGHQLEIIEQQDHKIRQLRAQLLKSSQNNINAIFNTQITEAQCLNLQIKKMNGEINTLKSKLDKINEQNHLQVTQMLHNHNPKIKQPKIINIYHHKHNSLDSSDDQDIRNEISKGKKGHSKNKNNRERRQSSSSDQNRKNRRLSTTQLKVGQLIDGYKNLRQEYKSLESTIQQLNSNQSQYKVFFNNLKTQISTSLSNQIMQVKQTIKRPSSNSEEKKLAKDLQSKLNHLINTLNAPEKASVQRSLEEQPPNQWKNQQSFRKISQLQAHNIQLQRDVRVLQRQKYNLQQKIMQLSRDYCHKSKEHIPNELQLNSIEGFKKRGSKEYQLQQLMMGSRSDIKQQEVMQHLPGMQNSTPVVHSSGINKLHSSQSYHQSSNKNTQMDNLHRLLQKYQQALREKEFRITELQNTIMDHFPSRAIVQQPITSSLLKQKYQAYINNLKLLLSQSKKQNQTLRKQFMKISELNLSRANPDYDRNSITLSDRTTKNHIAQTRMIQPHNSKPSKYESIQNKLHIQDQIQKIFIALLELYQTTLHLLQQGCTPLAASIFGCINWLINDARSQQSRLYLQTLKKEEIKRFLGQLRIQYI